jgi:hypothetical protein
LSLDEVRTVLAGQKLNKPVVSEEQGEKLMGEKEKMDEPTGPIVEGI